MLFLFFSAILINASYANDAGGGTDANNSGALQDTQRLLTTPQARNAAIKKDKNARRVNAQVKQLAGTRENTEEIYGLSSEVFARMTAEAGGDPKKLEKILKNLEKNPEQMERYMSTEDRARLQKLGNSISGTSNAKKTVTP